MAGRERLGIRAAFRGGVAEVPLRMVRSGTA
jgi:hypothetical protein